MATEKCANKICTCVAEPGSKYCSQQCEDSKDIETLGCECGHVHCGAAL